MTRPDRWISLSFLIGCVLIMPGATRAGVVVNAWDLRTLAVEQNNTPVIHNTVNMPFLHTDTDTDGATTSVSNYDFAHNGASGDFLFNFDHDRSNVVGAVATSTGTLDFDTSSGASKYVFTGQYDMFGTGFLFLQVDLTDLTLGVSVFNNTQESRATPSESFTLGLTGGDFANSVFGTPAGVLPAAHNYRLTYAYRLSHAVGDGQGASAHGFLNLGLEAVPEPGTLLLCVIGAASLLARRSRCHARHA